MSAIVLDAIAAEVAMLTPDVAAPLEPLGYGSDVRCSSDLDERAEEVGGFSTLALAEALVRRLDTPRGSLPDDPDYGLDVKGYCNRATTAAELLALAGQIRTELQKDDRVDLAAVMVAPSASGGTLAIQIRIVPVDPRLGPFALTLAASSAEVLLEAMAA